MPAPDRPRARVPVVFERLLEGVVLTLMVALAGVVVLGVTFRKLGAALVWYDEVASILLAWLTFYGAGYAALKRVHIGFPKLVEAAAPPVRKILLVVREITVVTFFVAVTWAGFKVLQILGGTSLVSLPAVPTRLTQSVIPIGAVLFIVAELISARDAWRGLDPGPNEPTS